MIRLALLLAVLTATGALAAEPAPIVGAWALDSGVRVYPDGHTTPLDFITDSAHATGTIVYDASGTMAVQIAGGSRPVLPPAPPPFVESPTQARVVLGSYYAYFGRWTLDVAHGLVRHLIAQSLDPSETGQVYSRHYVIEGDRLTLETQNRDPATQTFNRLVWHRIK